jgi:hypothetical protein
MNAVYAQLIKRIRGEVDDLDSVALKLHSFYSGLEGLFELIARNLDQTKPGGEMWHRDLLTQMSLEFPDARPAVISPDNASKLIEFLRSRHLVRNIYAANLSPGKMAGLVDSLPELWHSLRPELPAFVELLDQSS